jgi:DNA-binding response OmpR family regulator
MRPYISSLLGSSYQLDMAPDGAAAVSLARSVPPNLVLTEVMVPNLDSFGILSALRADPLLGGVPVIMLFARAGEGAAVVGLEAGGSLVYVPVCDS